MNEPPTWPPPPDVADPLAAHDEFLSACVHNSTPKPLLSRLRLVKDLREETGSDLRQCLAIVNNFCDRHVILMPLGGFQSWLPLLFSAVCFVVLLAMKSAEYMLEKSQDSAMTQAGKLAFRHERFFLDFVFAGVLLVSMSLTIIAILHQQKKAKAEAAEAAAKFAQ